MASLKDRLGCGLVVAGAGVVLVLFVMSVARTVQRTEPGPRAAPARSAPVAPADAPVEAKGSRALLDGLGPGDRVEGWRIARTRIVDGKRLAIDVWQGKTGFTVWIARKGSGKQLAPRQTEKYDFSDGEARTYGGPIPDGAQNKVLDAIVARVKSTEARVPTPPGL